MVTREEFILNLIDSGLMTPEGIQGVVQSIPVAERPHHGRALANYLVDQGMLTRYQTEAILGREFGRLSLGQYEVLDCIGGGGMGAVYKARHRLMKRIVAIKMLNRDNDGSATVNLRFKREVEILSGLQHPNIVAAHDASECEAGPFLVMEYVSGSDLKLIVEKDGAMPIFQAVDCVLQVARGLEYAHGRGVIHRDIKPANLLRDGQTGTIKIADLGLARGAREVSEQSPLATTLTATGNIIGTALYMAPEHADGSRKIDHRSDIYSLGCTLYFLLTGESPYLGSSIMNTILLHRTEPIPSLRDRRGAVPRSLDHVYQTMMAKSPGDRYQSMTDVLRALQECQADVANAVESEPPCAPVSPSFQARTAEWHSDSDEMSDRAVLLVEPSRAQSLLIRGLLESVGIRRTEHCRTAAEALALLKGFAADVILSAMHLPDMSGGDLAERVRAEKGPDRVGFVLISSSPDVKQWESTLHEHAVSVLVKPFDEGQLSRALLATSQTISRPS